MTRPKSNGQFESQLVTLLAWEAGQIAGAPDAEAMERRLVASLRIGASRRRPTARTVVGVAAVVALLTIALVGAAILGQRTAPRITPTNGDLVLRDRASACALDSVDPATGVHRALLSPPPDCGTNPIHAFEFLLSASTDGGRVAYSTGGPSVCPDCPGNEVWLLDTGTGSSTKVDGCGGVDCFMVPAISPDGRLLAFSKVFSSSSLNKVGTISIVDLRSGGQVTIRSEDAAGMRWSPDSFTLAFTEFVCEERLPCTRIETISADGSRRRTVFDDPTRTTSFPEWTPDGTHLRFGTMDRQGAASPMTLHEAAADGSGSVMLGTLLTAAGVLSPSWSPDGTRLAWLENGGRTEPESFVELWVGSADGQNAKRLVASGHGNVGGSGPIWSPDGQLLAFGYTFGGTAPGHTYVIGADGTGLHQVASVEGPLTWLPATSGP